LEGFGLFVDMISLVG